MAKKADALQPYQQRVVNRIADPDQTGLVVAHEMGTGKGLSSIESYKRLGLPTNVILPASLRANYEKELTKWTGGIPKNLTIDSQQLVARQGLKHDVPGGLQIVDEAHRARDPGSALAKALMQSRAKKRLLLTGTPIYNNPTDLANLISIAAQKPVLPTNEADFAKKFIEYEKIQPSFFQRLMGLKEGLQPHVTNRAELKKVLNKYVDYQASSKENYPTAKYQTIKVPMGNSQMQIYKTILGEVPWWVRAKVRYNLPPSRGELSKLQAFLTGARQVSNSTAGFVKNPSQIESPKIQKAFDFFQKQLATNPNYKAVVYSNYIENGLNPYKELLAKAKIPYGEFSGQIDQSERDDLVKQYNANKIKALLISSAGAEGLDLKNTALVQLLESHFNKAKENQIIGRAIRYKSHADLPPDQRKVLVQRYLAQPQSSFIDRMIDGGEVKGTDEYISSIADQKQLLSDEIMKLLATQKQ